MQQNMFDKLTEYEWAKSDLAVHSDYNVPFLSKKEIKRLKLIVEEFEMKYIDIEGFHEAVDHIMVDVERDEIIDDFEEYEEISVHNLSDNSTIRVNMCCDYCKQEYTTQYSTAVIKSVVHKHACNNCRNLKRKESNFIKYGVEETLNVAEIRNKIHNTWYENGIVKASRPQKHINKLLDGTLNKPIDGIFADILIDDNIIIEYDGSGHFLRVTYGDVTMEEALASDMRRDQYLRSKGYKIIRILSEEDYLPSDQIILEEIEKAKDYFATGGEFCRIVFDRKSDKHGKLRKIK